MSETLNPSQLAQDMHEAHQRKLDEARVNEWTDVTNEQSLNDFDAVQSHLEAMEQRSDQSNFLPESYDQTQDDPYENYSLSALARIWADAEEQNDKTIVEDVTDVIMERIDEHVAKSEEAASNREEALIDRNNTDFHGQWLDRVVAMKDSFKQQDAESSSDTSATEQAPVAPLDLDDDSWYEEHHVEQDEKQEVEAESAEKESPTLTGILDNLAEAQLRGDEKQTTELKEALNDKLWQEVDSSGLNAVQQKKLLDVLEERQQLKYQEALYEAIQEQAEKIQGDDDEVLIQGWKDLHTLTDRIASLRGLSDEARHKLYIESKTKSENAARGEDSQVKEAQAQELKPEQSDNKKNGIFNRGVARTMFWFKNTKLGERYDNFFNDEEKGPKRKKVAAGVGVLAMIGVGGALLAGDVGDGNVDLWPSFIDGDGMGIDLPFEIGDDNDTFDLNGDDPGTHAPEDRGGSGGEVGAPATPEADGAVSAERQEMIEEFQKPVEPNQGVSHLSERIGIDFDNNLQQWNEYNKGASDILRGLEGTYESGGLVYLYEGAEVSPSPAQIQQLLELAETIKNR